MLPLCSQRASAGGRESRSKSAVDSDEHTPRRDEEWDEDEDEDEDEVRRGTNRTRRRTRNEEDKDEEEEEEKEEGEPFKGVVALINVGALSIAVARTSSSIDQAAR